MPAFRQFCLLQLLLALSFWLAVGPQSPAGEVRLKNGMTYYGTPAELETLVQGPKKPNPLPTTTYPIWMVSSGLQRVFVPRRQVESVNRDIDLSKSEVFKLKHKPMVGASQPIGVVGDFLEKPKPFNEHGVRVVKLRLSPRKPEVFQGITEINPVYVKVEALNYDWKTALATSSIPVEILDPILRNANGSNDAEHRMKIAIFYIQAQMYGPAERELDAIAAEYPDRAETVKKAKGLLTQAKALDGLNELKLRRASGQHRFVSAMLRSFPVDNVDTAVLREVRDMTAEYDAARERLSHVQVLLAELQAALASDPRIADIAPRRSEIVESLNETNVERLESFLKLAADANSPPDEKLALALSGWVVGSENAVTELDQALRYWQARFLVMDYLRTSPDAVAERTAILERLGLLEGISAARVAQMLPLLPPALDSADTEPGKAARIQVSGSGDDSALGYWVMLPPEYHPDRRYPLLVALHSEKRPPEQELTFWSGAERPGPAMRHGYIVIVPEYTSKAGQTQYDYSPDAHRIVLDSIRDARRRFNVDSDRVFLAGHDMGGDAAFDIGFSHPDMFAGVIPICGVSDRYCEYYWDNARNLPLYVVSGEFDRNTVSKNAKELMRMMLRGFNVIYVEYVAAGPDSFYSEIHKLFDWMSRLRRNPLSKDIKVKTLRECDTHFGWYKFEGLPKTVVEIDWDAPKRGPVHPMSIEATINEANTVVISKSGAARHRIWLTPQDGMIDFDKRVGVRINGTQRFNDFVSPRIEPLLESFRYDGDRQRLYWGVLEFSGGR